MISYKDFKKQALQNPHVLKAYEAFEPEFAVVRMIVRKRIQKGLTQKALASKIGTKQSAIARLESGTYNPSLLFLKRVAHALDAQLTVSLSSKASSKFQ